MGARGEHHVEGIRRIGNAAEFGANSGWGRPSGRSRSEPANGGRSGNWDDSPPVKWATLSSWLISGDSVAAIDGGPVDKKLSVME